MPLHLAEKFVDLFKYEHIREADCQHLLPAIEANLDEPVPATVRMVLLGGGDLSWWKEMEQMVLKLPPNGLAIQSKTQLRATKAHQDLRSRAAEQNPRLFAPSYPPQMGYNHQYAPMSAGAVAGGGYPYQNPHQPLPQQQQEQEFYHRSMGQMPGYGDNSSWVTSNGPRGYGDAMQQNHGASRSYQAPPPNQEALDTLLHQNRGAGRSYAGDPSNLDIENVDDAEEVTLVASVASKGGGSGGKKSTRKTVPPSKGAEEPPPKKKIKTKNSSRNNKKTDEEALVQDVLELQDVESSSSEESISFPDRLESNFQLFQDNAPFGGTRNAYLCVGLENMESGNKADKMEGTNIWVRIGTSGHGYWANTGGSIHYKKAMIRHLDEVGGAMGNVKSDPQDCMKDELPRNRRDLPQNISFSERPMTASSWGASLMTCNNSSIPLPADALMVGTNESMHGCACSLHKCCGHYLEIGQRIVVLGANIKHQADGVYKIGCFVVLPGSRIGCKVGFLRAPFDQLGFFINRVADVTYVAPEPTEKPENKKHLYNILKGYCRITFCCEGGNFIQEPWKKSKRTGYARMKNCPPKADKKKNEDSKTKGVGKKEATGGSTG